LEGYSSVIFSLIASKVVQHLESLHAILMPDFSFHKATIFSRKKILFPKKNYFLTFCLSNKEIFFNFQNGLLNLFERLNYIRCHIFTSFQICSFYSFEVIHGFADSGLEIFHVL